MRYLLVAVLALVACGGKKKAHHDDAAVADAAATKPVVKPDAGTPPTPARVEHAVFDLVPNRHTAHRAVDGELVVDASSVDFARFTRFGLPVPHWRLGNTVENERAAIADKLASIEVPLNHAQMASTQLTLRIHGALKQSLQVKVNGRTTIPIGKKKPEATKLDPGWQTLAIPLDPKNFVVGENQITFETLGGKSGLAIAWLRIGEAKPAGDQDPRIAVTFDPKADSFDLIQNAEVAWYETIPDGANLVADVLSTVPSQHCRVEVAARAGDDSLTGGVLQGEGARLDLSGSAGKVVRLSLITRDCLKAHVVHPRITLHGPAPTALPKSDPPKYIILWVMDALRADKIPIFTPGARAQTPNFDELAKSSTVFRQFYVQGNESQASHSSDWTSTYPAVHGVRLAGDPKFINSNLDRHFDLIATQLKDAGFFTTACTGNGYVNTEDGYDRGFKEFRNMMRETGVENNLIYGQKIVDAALGQLDKHRENPTYLFMGTIDTHGPWVARKPWIDIYSPGPYHGPFVEFGTAKDLGFKPGSMGCSIIPPPADVERLRAIYDSAVSYHDQQVGRLVAQLKAWGIWDQTMLIITADHGEELFEDVRCGHGGSLRDTLVRVPLLVHDPSRFPAGTIVDEGAEGVDLLPSMLSAIDKPIIEQAQGTPLEPLAQGFGKGWARPSYASMYEYAHVMRIGRWKARVARSGIPLLNDMVGDPSEMKDETATHPVERRMLTDSLGLFMALRTKWKKSTWGVTNAMTPEGAAILDEAFTP
ncbi:MAG: sulfatase-like hydrolase/transferase [Kofleriaceae bacterium]